MDHKNGWCMRRSRNVHSADFKVFFWREGGLGGIFLLLATPLVCYLPSRIERALMKQLLNLIIIKKIDVSWIENG